MENLVNDLVAITTTTTTTATANAPSLPPGLEVLKAYATPVTVMAVTVVVCCPAARGRDVVLLGVPSAERGGC